jgi:hypothetical protein
MSVTLATEFFTFSAATVVAPYTNSKQVRSSILPQRFGSTSVPSETPIISPDLTSISEPKLVKKSKLVIESGKKDKSDNEND